MFNFLFLLVFIGENIGLKCWIGNGGGVCKDLKFSLFIVGSFLIKVFLYCLVILESNVGKIVGFGFCKFFIVVVW